MKNHSRDELNTGDKSPTAEEIETMLKVLNRAYRQTQEEMASSTRNAARYVFQNTWTWFNDRHIDFSLDEKAGAWKLGKKDTKSEK